MLGAVAGRGGIVELGAILGLGLFLGMRHATDADHVVAVATIVARRATRRSAALIGASWGLGHTTTIFGVGAAIILFKVVIPPALGLGMELAVAMMLVLLGVLNLAGAMRRWGHRHQDNVDGAAGADGTAMAGGWFRRPFAIGIVHGLAGSAAVALLVLATIRDPYWALFYLLLFGAGTILGMVLITVGMASVLAGASRGSARTQRGLGYASGLASLCFGLFITYQIGWVYGLFTGHPRWTPH